MTATDEPKLLVVEDDPLFADALQQVLLDAGFRSRLARSGSEALEAAEEETYDLVLQDLRLPDAGGLDVLKEILERQPHCGAVVMTAYGTIDAAVEAMKIGAFDFITKPFPMEVLFAKVQRFLEFRKTEKAVPAGTGDPFEAIITRSPAVTSALRSAAAVSGTDASILILGESGTGKELVAEAIHRGSRRRGGPFIKVNCASIPATLIESELFGVEKGAFTGADRSRPGYFEAADGGTIFLDEIGELPHDLQGKLLRVLEEKGAARVGSAKFRPIDFRLVSATNRDLLDLVARREFRNDLFYRLNVVSISLPPLRDRKEDIPLLLAHFLADASQRHGSERPELTPEALELLETYSYPGNIRELRNIIESIVILHGGGKVYPRDLPPEVRERQVSAVAFEAFEVGKPLKDAVAEYERKYIEKVLDHTGGKKTIAAKVLGLSRKVLWEKLNR